MAANHTTLELETPPLQDGDRLTRAEFERRWEAMPSLKKAELIEGVVHTSPTVTSDEGMASFEIIGWLGLYQRLTPGVEGSASVSIPLDNRNVLQPNATLRILDTHRGQCKLTSDRHFDGVPELIAEIASTSKGVEDWIRRGVYRCYGVREYIVWGLAEHTVNWFTYPSGSYSCSDKHNTLNPGSDGIIRSEVFPGLWLDPIALMNNDTMRVVRVAQLGHGSPEHCEFVAELSRRAGGN